MNVRYAVYAVFRFVSFNFIRKRYSWFCFVSMLHIYSVSRNKLYISWSCEKEIVEDVVKILADFKDKLKNKCPVILLPDLHEVPKGCECQSQFMHYKNIARHLDKDEHAVLMFSDDDDIWDE